MRSEYLYRKRHFSSDVVDAEHQEIHTNVIIHVDLPIITGILYYVKVNLKKICSSCTSQRE